MKNIFCFVFFLFSVPAFATDYYSVKSGNAADVNTWNSDRNGNGTAPASFNNAEDNFYVQNGSSITAVQKFSCKGSLIIETGGTYITGNAGNTTAVGSIVTINQGGVFKLSQNTSLITGFILIQGNLENQGGNISFSNVPPVAYSSRRQNQ